MKRLFMGIPLGESVKEQINLFSKELADTGGDFRFVSPQNLHLTLSFLGDIEERKIPLLVEKLSSLLAKQEKLKIKIFGVGVFPGGKRINVIWLGLRNGVQSKELIDFMKKINQTLAIRNRHEEEIPHLTIARVKSGKNKEKISEIVKKFAAVSFGSFVADKIILYESELTPEGPVYKVVGEFLLG